MDVGHDTSGGNGDATQQAVELLVVADGQLDVAGDDAGALVVASGVAGQLQDLGRQVLEHGGEVDGRASSDAVSVAAIALRTSVIRRVKQPNKSLPGGGEYGPRGTADQRGWSARWTCRPSSFPFCWSPR